MTSFISRVFSSIFPFSKCTHKVLVVGLDASGKTSLLYQWSQGELVGTVPTRVPNTEDVQHRDMTFAMWDVGGSSQDQPLWRHYFQSTDYVIFVVDSSDVDRFTNASSCLRYICEDPELKSASILVMANKQDLPGAVSVEEINNKLCLATTYPDRLIHVQGCSAVTREGIMEGLDWLHDSLMCPSASS